MDASDDLDFLAGHPTNHHNARGFSCYDSPHISHASPSQYEPDEDIPSRGGPLATPVSSDAGLNVPLEGKTSPVSVDSLSGHCTSPTDEAMEVESDETEGSPATSLNWVNELRNEGTTQDTTARSYPIDGGITEDLMPNAKNTSLTIENVTKTSDIVPNSVATNTINTVNYSQDKNIHDLSAPILKTEQSDTCVQHPTSPGLKTSPLPSPSSRWSSSPCKVKVGLSCGSSELPNISFSSSVASCHSEEVTPQGTSIRNLKRLSPPASATNSLTRRSNKRRADDSVRRSWDSTTGEQEYGSGDLWASIQGPYDYIMTSFLLPPHSTSTDSLNKPPNLSSSRTSLSTSTAAALASLTTSNPFPV
ncbi:uncharacterized protein PB18E9.04c, partial [Hyalella azteca]|uniref:Uncharacterized protein PB18E9.04c n=1 Tax=Hyalella azteca TaxID=294128 RepID=A0A8B7P5N8_HYAAZ